MKNNSSVLETIKVIGIARAILDDDYRTAENWITLDAGRHIDLDWGKPDSTSKISEPIKQTNKEPSQPNIAKPMKQESISEIKKEEQKDTTSSYLKDSQTMSTVNTSYI